jgi:hypothetical protein
MDSVTAYGLASERVAPTATAVSGLAGIIFGTWLSAD